MDEAEVLREKVLAFFAAWDAWDDDKQVMMYADVWEAMDDLRDLVGLDPAPGSPQRV